METCYTNLANAIILAAAKDHRRALRRLKNYPWDKNAESVRKDFQSSVTENLFAGFRTLLQDSEHEFLLAKAAGVINVEL